MVYEFVLWCGWVLFTYIQLINLPYQFLPSNLVFIASLQTEGLSYLLFFLILIVHHIDFV